MDLPFYYSFKIFERSYAGDFKKWQDCYPDGTERDFIIELRELYEKFVSWSGSYRFKDFGLYEYKYVMEERIKYHLYNDVFAYQYETDEELLNDNPEIDFMDYYEECDYLIKEYGSEMFYDVEMHR